MTDEPFLNLKIDHKTILTRDLDVFRTLRDFTANNGYVTVYETERIGEAKTAMATFACRNTVHGECLAIVYGMSAEDEVAHPRAPFEYGFGGTKPEDVRTYVQHAALRTSDLFALREHLEGKGAQFLTPIFEDKDSFGPLLQCFGRELFQDEWFFFEFVQRDYDPDALPDAGGTQFVDKTVRSLYEAKQDEFREWLETGKKRTFTDGMPEAKATALLREIVDRIEPAGAWKTLPPLARQLA